MHPLILPAIIGGLSQYSPRTMVFNGTDSYYRLNNITTSNNRKQTLTVRFNIPSFSGGGSYTMLRLYGGTGDNPRILIIAQSNDHAVTTRRGKIQVSVVSSSGTALFLGFSDGTFVDGEDHTLFLSVDSNFLDKVHMYIDGVDVLDTANPEYISSVAGEVDYGPGSYLLVGANVSGGTVVNGQMGYIGYRDAAYLENPTDFYDPVNGLQEVDEDTWSEWGAQPMFWNKYGLMSENKGTAGNMSRTGLIEGPVLEYDPGMMQYDGSTGYYRDSAPSPGITNNLSTGVFRFNQTSATGGSYEQLVWYSVLPRFRALLFDTDYSDATRAGKLQVMVNDAAGTTICRLISKNTLVDGEDHFVFFAFDGDNGTAIFYIDGVDADDTGHASRLAPTTGTLYTTSPMISEIGRHQTPGNYFSGKIGYVGYKDSYETNPLDFYHPDTGLTRVSESSWFPWSGRPYHWNPKGEMSDNRGDGDQFLESGTITGPAGGIEPYDPGMMTSDGSTGYYSGAATTAVNSASTVVARFNAEPWLAADGGAKWITKMQGNSGKTKLEVVIYASDYTFTDRRKKLEVFAQNLAGDFTLRLLSKEEVCDGTDHVVFISYDPVSGAATFYIDGEDADDPDYAERTLTSGTTDSGTGTLTVAGLIPYGKIPGSFGFYGYRAAYLDNPGDFMDGSYPVIIDDTDWTEWGAQPDYWNEYGKMDDNKGYRANLTANGTLTGPA